MDILIVEDEAITRAVLSQMLAGRGHRIVQCTSAEQAIEQCRQNFFPLVILDLVLPGLSGLDFCRWLRQQTEGERPYILVGTGNQEARDLREILKAGADDYLAKPYLADLLHVRVAIAERVLHVRAGQRNLEQDLQQERARLLYLSGHDGLTKLCNRAQFAEAVENAVAAAQSGGRAGSLLVFDLDHFSLVNNAAGHPGGDRLLVQIAYLLRNAAQPADVVARCGDDSFAILQPNIAPVEARLTAERIRQHVIDLRFCDSGKSFAVTISGSVTAVTGESNADHLLAAADAACYAAKARGRNRIEVTADNPRELIRLRDEHAWAGQVRQAFKQNGVAPWFNPVVGLETGQVVSHEVSTRLRTAEGEWAEPALFLPGAESAKLVPEIEHRLIKILLRRLAAEPGLQLSFALSRPTIDAWDLSEFISSAFDAAGVSPPRLIFEFDAAEANLNAARGLLESLAARGFRFGLSGLGAGSWSGAELRSLPLAYLKIPGKAVRGLTTDPLDRACVKFWRDTARTLGIESRAAGVNSAATLKALRALEVSQGQGSHFARPGPELQP